MQPCCNIRCRRQDGGNDRMFNGEGGTTNIQLTFERERENRFEPAARRATPAGRDTAVSLLTMRRRYAGRRPTLAAAATALYGR